MSKFNAKVPVEVIGHLNIVDDLGNVLLDKSNAIHPQNMARVFARALSNENNYYINRIAYGNGGTTVDAAFNISYNPPNDGQSPDVATWNSRLYHETYSEIINAGQGNVPNPDLGKDFGSADVNTGVRPGGGSVPSNDPITVPHVSGPGCRSVELGLVSEVIISSVLNASEPTSQYLSDSNAATNLTNPTGDFVFDEVGLYTSGAQAIPTNGYQNVNVGDKLSTDDTGLIAGYTYQFTVTIDGGTSVPILFTTPIAGGSGPSGQILYGDLCEAINTGAIAWGFSGANPLPGTPAATIAITDYTSGTFPSIANAVTYGFLSVSSGTAGAGSAVLLVDGPTGGSIRGLFASLNPPLMGTLEAAVPGTDAGIQNAPTNPTIEGERLLTHLIFSPVLKSANRTLAITYTLSISVARTPST